MGRLLAYNMCLQHVPDLPAPLILKTQRIHMLNALHDCMSLCTHFLTSTLGKKNQHTCKEERNTLPNLRQNKQGPHNPDHNMERGGGG